MVGEAFSAVLKAVTPTTEVAVVESMPLTQQVRMLIEVAAGLSTLTPPAVTASRVIARYKAAMQ